MSWSDKWKSFTSTPSAQKTGTAFKKLETKVWRVLEPVGKGSNRLAGKLGVEGFWPTEIAEGEIDKAARILRTFTLDAVETDAEVEAANNATNISEANSDNTTENIQTNLEERVEAKQPEQVEQSLPPPQHPAVQQNSPKTPSDKYASRKTQRVIKKIPPKVLREAAGIAIFTCFRTGLWISGSGGSGVVMARLPDGSWGPPSGILIHTIGVGFLVGLDVYDVVLIIRKPETLKAFTNPKVSLGAELSVAAGPVGNGAMLDSGVDAKPCWSYTKSKGVYAGVQLDGTIILKRDDANGRFYGQPISVADIFAGKGMPQKEAVKPLWATLYAAEGRTDMVDFNQIPQGAAPGEIEIAPEDAKELEAMAGQEQQGQQGGNPSSGSAKPGRFVAPSFVDKNSTVESSGIPQAAPQNAPSTQTADVSTTSNLIDLSQGNEEAASEKQGRFVAPTQTEGMTGLGQSSITESAQTAPLAQSAEVPTTSNIIDVAQNNEQAPPISSSAAKDEQSGAPPSYTERE